MSVDDEPPFEDDEERAETPSAPAGSGWRDWLTGHRGWVMLAIIAVLQAVFAIIMLTLKGGGKQAADEQAAVINALAVEMLGREVSIGGVNQVISGPGGKRMTIGLDLVLVLGQLPEERIEGAPRPNEQEMEAFMAAIGDMEPRIRSRMNSLLQRISYDEYGDPEIYDRFRNDIMKYVNDEFDTLNFASLRPGIGKRRVTEILLPMFVRQVM